MTTVEFLAKAGDYAGPVISAIAALLTAWIVRKTRDIANATGASAAEPSVKDSVARIEGKLDGFIAASHGRFAAIEERLTKGEYRRKLPSYNT